MSIISLNAQPGDTIIKGVYVGFTYTPEFFPPEWRNEPINAYGEQIDANEIARAKDVAMRAIGKYKALVLENVRAVYFLKAMKFYNVPYGGTNSNDMIYVVNNGQAAGYTDRYLEQTFHHEFSSILFRNFSAYLDTNAWKRSNEPGFLYNDPEFGVGAIRKNLSSQDINTELCEKGLLTQYASSSIENDINSIAQNLFIPDPGFWAAVDTYPRIREKTTRLIRFYNRIDPSFSEKFFRNFDSL